MNWEHAPALTYDGNLKFGFWGHTGTFTRFDGVTQRGAEGFYAILDQTLWQPAKKEQKDDTKKAADNETDDRGLRAFLEYGRTDGKVLQVWQHVGGGLAWKGLLPKRADDVIGVSPQYAFLSGQAGSKYSDELAVEGFYKAKLMPWVTLEPDLQFIQHPGGQYPNAVVGTLQLTLQL